jgi:hypothetical protein
MLCYVMLYVAVCVQLYYRCFTVLHLVVAVLHYMFRPTWPCSSVYDDLLLYSWRNLLHCFCCLFLHVVILCTFPFVFLFCCVFFFVNFMVLVCVCVCVCVCLQARRQHNLKTYWAIQCSRMLKYSIMIYLLPKLFTIMKMFTKQEKSVSSLARG